MARDIPSAFREKKFQSSAADKLSQFTSSHEGQYLAIVLDVFSRRIVGWATSEHIDAALVCAAMRRALCGRVIPRELIFHSDRGSQYTSHAFRDLLGSVEHIRQSQGLSCYDNAITETVFHTLKTECVDDEDFRTRIEAHRTVFEYIEAFYNTTRRHSALDYVSPMQFEHAWNRHN